MIIIPFANRSRFRINVSFDNVSYRLFFNWNTRGNYWVMSMFLPNGDIVLGETKIVLGVNLFEQFQHLARIPKGILFAARLNGNDNSPLKDFEFYQGEAWLSYVSLEELENV